MVLSLSNICLYDVCSFDPRWTTYRSHRGVWYKKRATYDSSTFKNWFSFSFPFIESVYNETKSTIKGFTKRRVVVSGLWQILYEREIPWQKLQITTTHISPLFSCLKSLEQKARGNKEGFADVKQALQLVDCGVSFTSRRCLIFWLGSFVFFISWNYTHLIGGEPSVCPSEVAAWQQGPPGRSYGLPARSPSEPVGGRRVSLWAAPGGTQRQSASCRRVETSQQRRESIAIKWKQNFLAAYQRADDIIQEAHHPLTEAASLESHQLPEVGAARVVVFRASKQLFAASFLLSWFVDWQSSIQCWLISVSN